MTNLESATIMSTTYTSPEEKSPGNVSSLIRYPNESVNWVLDVVRQQKFALESEDVNTEQELVEAETRAILDRILELGDGDIVVGYARAVESGVVDSPMSPNVHVRGNVLGVRDTKGAARYLEFGNLPIPQEIKEFHRVREG